MAARTGGVFASAAAEEWRRFLHGVESPERLTLVRLAASSLLMGYSPQQIAALTDEEALELQRRMQEWRETLVTEGVPALLAAVQRSTGLSARVLALADGERTMTDLTHLAEEMHAVWRRRRIGSLVGWLETTMAEAAQRDEANIEEAESRQRRLETDAAAVQVQTIHGAKGLQWPVVLVPYLWDVSTWKPPVPVFHGDEGVPRERLIDVGGRDAPGYADHQKVAAAEDAAEEGRLLYVALTRAEHHLMAWWVENSTNTAISKLNGLITKDDRTPDDLVTAGGGTIAVETLDELPPVVEYRPDDEDPKPLERARFERRLDYDWRRASFSSLSPEHPIGAAAETIEQPPREDESDLAVEPDEEITPAGESVCRWPTCPAVPASGRWSTTCMSTCRSTPPTSRVRSVRHWRPSWLTPPGTSTPRLDRPGWWHRWRLRLVQSRTPRGCATSTRTGCSTSWCSNCRSAPTPAPFRCGTSAR